jgi:citronellol/citronellal dehydrogenase
MPPLVSNGRTTDHSLSALAMSYQSIFRPALFDGRLVVVTGGGSGIGRCIAHELVSLGAAVAIVGRTVDKLERVAAELREQGGRASVHACDIREEPAVRDTVSAILGEHGHIDGLVNNAGGQFPAPLETISGKGWDAVVRNNLSGGFLFSRECYTQWMAKHVSQASCGIVNIIADMWHGMPGMAHSGAARAGMLNLTETASLEWAPLRVNAVAPGIIASSGMDRYPPEHKPIILAAANTIPLRRLGTESEVSAAVVFLLSPAAAFISGACLRVDGAGPNARRMWPRVGGKPNEAFNGFHLAELPAILRGG